MNRRAAAQSCTTATFALAFPPITLSGDDAALAGAIVALGGRVRRAVKGRSRRASVEIPAPRPMIDYGDDLAMATVETVVEPRSFSRETNYPDDPTTLIDWRDDREELRLNQEEWERRRARVRRA